MQQTMNKLQRQIKHFVQLYAAIRGISYSTKNNINKNEKKGRKIWQNIFMELI